jgi:hypothetical protein
VILRTACKSNHPNEDQDLILTDFAEFLNADQQQYLAMKYLQTCSIKSNQGGKLANLKNRIFYSAPQLQTIFAKPPPDF